MLAAESRPAALTVSASDSVRDPSEPTLTDALFSSDNPDDLLLVDSGVSDRNARADHIELIAELSYHKVQNARAESIWDNALLDLLEQTLA